MFQSNSFAATLALCFSSVSASAIAADSVQLDIYHGSADVAQNLIDRWKTISANNHEPNQEDSVKLQATLIPVDRGDDRIFVVWTGIQQNLPPSKEIAMLHDKVMPEYSFALEHTDFSSHHWDDVGPDEVIELRTYVTTEGNLDELHRRFSEHTMRLFEKHGMKNVEYYQLFDKESMTLSDILKALSPKGQDTSASSPEQNPSDIVLVYFLAHRSKEAAGMSFTNFRADPDWIAAKAASEDKAGGSLTVGNGVKSLFLKQVR
jgi:hypothetical protein